MIETILFIAVLGWPVLIPLAFIFLMCVASIE